MNNVYALGEPLNADLFATKEEAIKQAVIYIRDSHWQEKLSEIDRQVLNALLLQDETLALRFYNERCGVGNRWEVFEQEVRTSAKDLDL